MHVFLAAVGALGLGLIGMSGASAIPMNAASLDAAAGANSPTIKIVARNFNRWPGCEHLRSFNPQTRTFIGRDGHLHHCTRPPGH